MSHDIYRILVIKPPPPEGGLFLSGHFEERGGANLREGLFSLNSIIGGCGQSLPALSLSIVIM